VVITLCAVGTKTCAVGSDAIAISILALAELDVKHADAPNEVESIARNVDISALVRLDLDQGQGILRHADLRRIPEGDVVQPFHWRLHGRGAERRKGGSIGQGVILRMKTALAWAQGADAGQPPARQSKMAQST
jgi:hypothetical protein